MNPGHETTNVGAAELRTIPWPIVDPAGEPARLHAAIAALGSKVWDPPQTVDGATPNLRFFVVGYRFDGERWTEHVDPQATAADETATQP